MRTSKTTIHTFRVTTDDVHPVVIEGNETSASMSLPHSVWACIPVKDIPRIIAALAAYEELVR